jgi:pimeloyl-ACP methyl ester carboxylesterase
MTVATPSVAHVYRTGDAGNRLHLLDFGGTGRPLILLHGVTGHAWTWYEVARGLTDRRHVLALDFRGYGESQWSAGHEYRTSDHVADLTKLIGDMGETEVDLMGSSWGALAAIQYAAEHPVGRLVLVDVEASFEQSETDLFPRPASYGDDSEIRTAEAQRNPNASPEMISLLAATGYSPASGGRFLPKHDPFFFERWPFRSDDHWERLGRITSTTLLVHAADSFVRRDVMAEMADRIPESTLVEVSPSGHMVPVDNPLGLLDMVRPFFG